MSFRCSSCKVAYPNPQHPDEKRPTKVITGSRPRDYHTDRGTYAVGWEIRSEENICTPCANNFQPITVDLSSVYEKNN